MVDDQPAGRRGSRRELLGAGGTALTAGVAALGAGTLLAGCGGSTRSPAPKKATVQLSDVPILNRLLDFEYYAVAAYSAGIPLLDPPISKAAVQFLSQELAHVGSLGVLIGRVGDKPNKPRASYDLGDPRDAGEVLALLHHVERLQLRAYLEQIPRLSGGPLRAAVTAIFANDAQHIAVLRTELGLDPSPAPFVGAAE